MPVIPNGLGEGGRAKKTDVVVADDTCVSAAAVRCYLPEVPWDDLLPNILNRLPLHSICRLMSVSKYWRSLIIDNFHRFQRKPITCYVWHKGLHLYSVDEHGIVTHVCTCLHIPDIGVCKLQLQLSNGLLCSRQHLRDHLVVCNPKTQEKPLALPNKSTDEWHLYYSKFQFAFDPYSNKYKVLDCTDYPRCQIFTLGTTTSSSSWRTITCTVATTSNKWNIMRRACIGTMMYWYDTEANTIITFDLVNESFGEIQAPNRARGAERTSFITSVFEFEGCLSLAEYHYDVVGGLYIRKLDLWMFKDCNCKPNATVWVMVKSIDVADRNLIRCTPFWTRRGEILLARSDNGHTLHLYSLLTQQFSTLKISGLTQGVSLRNYVEGSIIYL